MKVTIDGRMIAHTGIGTYVRNLASFLPRITRKHSFRIIVNEKNGLADESGLEYVETSSVIPIYSIKEQLKLPLEVRRTKPDIVHYPSFNMPLLGRGRVVVTIHDLIYYIFPEACPSLKARAYAKVMFMAAARSSKEIITVSEHTKRDIVTRLGVRPEKISVIYHGIDPAYKPQKDGSKLKSTLEKYSIKGDFIFYVGNHFMNKNLERLITAFSEIKNKNVQLVLGGKPDTRRKALYEMPNRLGVSERVTFIGRVDDEDLPRLYSACTLFIFPSLYEGFGLPPLEAMSCGAPVLSSSATSLPEVVGDGAILFNPYETAEIKASIDRALESTALRDELREKGIQRAQLFDWMDTASKTLSVYEKAFND